jgi:hypothetical protein
MRVEIEYTDEMKERFPTWEEFFAFVVYEYFFDNPRCEENRKRYFEQRREN